MKSRSKTRQPLIVKEEEEEEFLIYTSTLILSIVPPPIRPEGEEEEKEEEDEGKGDKLFALLGFARTANLLQLQSAGWFLHIYV